MNAIVIGASSGIGKGLASLLVQEGYNVVITGRRKEKLIEIQKLYPNKMGSKQHDVCDLSSSEKVFREIVKDFGKVDLVVYCSGLGEPNYELLWEKEYPTLQTNIVGAAKIFGLAYQLFHKQGYGHLVGISSVAAIRGNRHVPAYFASKAFQKNYLESLWLKGKKSKADIYVTDIIPGFVDTDMAIGNTFWMADIDKATKQIFTAIKKKKKRAYISKRWRLIAIILRIIPSQLLLKI